MKQTKMNLANLQGKLSRNEMKNIMAGDNPGGGNIGCSAQCEGTCSYVCLGTTYNDGNCRANSGGTCFCGGSC